MQRGRSRISLPVLGEPGGFLLGRSGILRGGVLGGALSVPPRVHSLGRTSIAICCCTTRGPSSPTTRATTDPPTTCQLRLERRSGALRRSGASVSRYALCGVERCGQSAKVGNTRVSHA